MKIAEHFQTLRSKTVHETRFAFPLPVAFNGIFFALLFIAANKSVA
jgi:hypothetical protein